MSAQNRGIDKQRAVFTAIATLLDNVQEPTQKRIMLLTGIKRRNAITDITNRLHERGYITKSPRKRGAIALTEYGQKVWDRLK